MYKMIDLTKLREAFYKIAAEEKDHRAEAMMGAAATAKPSFAPAMPDFTSGKEEGAEGPDLQKELEDSKKQIERLEKEKRIAQQNFEFEQIKSRKAEAMHELEQRERQGLDKIRQQQEKLDQQKVLAQADEIRHQSKLQQQQSDSLLKVQQDKNKALMDLHQKGLQMQMQAADDARNQMDKYKDDARKQIDKERADMQKQQQQAFAQQQQQRQQQGTTMSPALKSVMTGAIKTLSQAATPKAVKLPKPGKAPISANISTHQPQQQLQRQPESQPLQQPTQIPVPGKSPVLKQASSGIKPEPEVSPTWGNPYSEGLLNIDLPELESGLLGQWLGPQFSYYKTMDKYKQNTNRDYVFDPAKFISMYAEHWRAPNVWRMNPRIYRDAPGPYSVMGAMTNRSVIG